MKNKYRTLSKWMLSFGFAGLIVFTGCSKKNATSESNKQTQDKIVYKEIEETYTHKKLTPEEEQQKKDFKKNNDNQGNELSLQRHVDSVLIENANTLIDRCNALEEKCSSLEESLRQTRQSFFYHLYAHCALLIAIILYLLIRKPITQPGFTKVDGKCPRCGGDLIDESGSRICKSCDIKY